MTTRHGIAITPHAHHELQVLSYIMSAALERKVTYSEAITIAAQLTRNHPELIASTAQELADMEAPTS